MDLCSHVPEPRCAAHTPEPARVHAHDQEPTRISGTRVRRSQPLSASAPAFLGSEHPLVDNGRGTGSRARSSLLAQWRVPVTAAPSATRSGRGSMWASNYHITVRMGREDPERVRTRSGQDSLLGPPCPSSPFNPLHPARWRPSAQVQKSLASSLYPHQGVSWGGLTT